MVHGTSLKAHGWGSSLGRGPGRAGAGPTKGFRKRGRQVFKLLLCGYSELLCEFPSSWKAINVLVPNRHPNLTKNITKCGYQDATEGWDCSGDGAREVDSVSSPDGHPNCEQNQQTSAVDEEFSWAVALHLQQGKVMAKVAIYVLFVKPLFRTELPDHFS